MESFAVDPKSFVILSLRFQFNLTAALTFLFDESLSPSVVNHTFLYLHPRDR